MPKLFGRWVKVFERQFRWSHTKEKMFSLPPPKKKTESTLWHSGSDN